MPSLEKQLNILGTCAMCGVTLRREFYAVGDQKFCCEACHEMYMTEDKEKLRRRFGTMMEHMCVICPAAQVKDCRDEILAIHTHMPELRKTQTEHWCPHMEQEVSAIAYDDTVSFDIALAIQKRSEEIAKANGRSGIGVLPYDYIAAVTEMSKNYDFKPNESTYKRRTAEIPPEERATLIQLNIDVHKSCSVCPAELRSQCDEGLSKEFPEVRRVQKVLGPREQVWCGHVGTMLGRAGQAGMEDEKIRKLAQYAEQIAIDKSHPGVLPQDLYVAIGRTMREKSKNG